MHEKYIDYIKNTGLVPLPIRFFDEDWEPIGPSVRRRMVEEGSIQEKDGMIYLVEIDDHADHGGTPHDD